MRDESARVDVNRASREELVAAGVTPELAGRILDHRAARGPIRDENELYLLVRDNDVRLDQLMGIVDIGGSADRQGYST
jgi:transcriptional accessory protein Tex/SPT6